VARDSFEYKNIDVVNLLLDLNNPRFEAQQSQRDALKILAVELGQGLIRLAEHIAQNGTNPSEMPIVIESENGNYIVLEGNRRLAAIKLCSEPKLVDSLNLPSDIAKRLKSVNQKHSSNLPVNLQCAVAPNYDIAKMWIELRHTGHNEGVGIISWNGIAAARFRGESPEIQLLEIVKESQFLDNETRDKLSKISITNLQRLLNTPEARQILGIDLKAGQIVFLEPDDKDDVIGRLAIVISDISNKYIKVTHLDSKDQRVTYATAVSSRNLPLSGEKIPATVIDSQADSKPQAIKTKRQKSTAKIRKTLIPITLKLNITQVRISRIFDELKRLKINEFENSSAVLLRVFMEMSLNEFARINRIRLKKEETDKSGKKTERNLTLKERVACIVDYLVDNDPSSKRELHGIRILVSSKDTIFSISNWHEYVHNQHYNPIASELMKIWDNIQPLFEKVWA